MSSSRWSPCSTAVVACSTAVVAVDGAEEGLREERLRRVLASRGVAAPLLQRGQLIREWTVQLFVCVWVCARVASLRWQSNQSTSQSTTNGEVVLPFGHTVSYTVVDTAESSGRINWRTAA